jgi:flavodoxin
MKIMIIYYSLSGNTRQVAKALANTCNADIESIQDKKIRSGFSGILRTSYEALFSHCCEINDIRKDPSNYDLIILGTPVWMGKLSSPMRSYIIKEKSKFQKVAFFCTESSTGASTVFKTMAQLCAKQPIATLEVTGKNIKSVTYPTKVEKFSQLFGRSKPVPTAKDTIHV